jgi:exodeoxyribonuclease III
MAFRKKAGLLMSYQPDILVIPECEHPDKLLFDKDIPSPKNILWFGENRSKGLGVFSYNDFTIKTLPDHTDTYKLIVPIAVKSPGLNFTLIAVWANNPTDPDGPYITQVWKAIHHYKTHLSKRKIILAGDFNSNTIWDKPRREWNHSTVVEVLQKKGIESVYHRHFNQIQGKENHPTLFMYRHFDKPYHIDYCFASKQMLKQLKSVTIGDFDFWKPYSDHVPLITTFG